MRKLYLISFVLVCLLIYSCELDINRDPNYPTVVTADKYFSSGLMWTTSAIGGDLELMGGLWSQHYAQHVNANQYSSIDSYNLANNNIYITRTWSALYAGALADFQLAMEKAEAAGEWNYWMASKIMTAYNYHLLVECFGNIPFTEALDFDNHRYPVFDDSKSVNTGIIGMLDEAITKRDEAALLSTMGPNDFVFSGDITNWVRFAKSLKLKILMRDPVFSANQAAIQALLTDDELLDSDSRIVVFEDKENNSNPLYENDRRKLNTPQNIRASSTLSLFLFQNGDPRAAVFMEEAVTPDPVYGSYVGLPQGGYTLGSAYGNKTSRARIGATDPVYFMSLAEVEFLKAEAYVLLGGYADAKTSYENGVSAAFDRWINETDENNQPIIPSTFNINDFIGSGKPYQFDQTTSAKMLESIWRQKWIAGCRSQAWEAFLESNRTGYPRAGTVSSLDPSYIIGNFAPSINSVLAAGEFPKRLIYPKTSSDYNPNTPQVIPIQTKLWWHR